MRCSWKRANGDRSPKILSGYRVGTFSTGLIGSWPLSLRMKRRRCGLTGHDPDRTAKPRSDTEQHDEADSPPASRSRLEGSSTAAGAMMSSVKLSAVGPLPHIHL
jgi:hypothetical protein